MSKLKIVVESSKILLLLIKNSKSILESNTGKKNNRFIVFGNANSSIKTFKRRFLDSACTEYLLEGSAPLRLWYFNTEENICIRYSSHLNYPTID